MSASVCPVDPFVLHSLSWPLPRTSSSSFSHTPSTFSSFSTTHSSAGLPVAACTSDIPLFTVASRSREQGGRGGLGYRGGRDLREKGWWRLSKSFMMSKMFGNGQVSNGQWVH